MLEQRLNRYYREADVLDSPTSAYAIGLYVKSQITGASSAQSINIDDPTD